VTVPGIAMVAAVLLAVGYAVLGALILLPATSRASRPLLPILNTETVIAAAAIVPFLLPAAVRLPLLLALAARILWEAASVAVLRRRDRQGLATLIASAAIAAIVAGTFQFALDGAAKLLAIAALVAVLALCLLASRRIGDGSALARLASETALFPAVPLGLTVAAAMDEARIVPLLGVLILVETFDSYALLGGKLFGRHRIFPRLSPNKTAEGLFFGAAMLLFTALALARITGAATMPEAAVVAMLAAIATVAGDLLASRLKRASGVKDYPAVMRHQGGTLDIADAAIMAGAVVALLPL